MSKIHGKSSIIILIPSRDRQGADVHFRLSGPLAYARGSDCADPVCVDPDCAAPRCTRLGFYDFTLLLDGVRTLECLNSPRLEHCHYFAFQPQRVLNWFALVYE